jgi:hypothetical protein
MPQIVQFTHPGPEHGPNKRGGNHKSWNTGSHKRKFLLTEGEYIVENECRNGELVFWGEWEPPSHVEQFAVRGIPSRLFPRWLHRPYLPAKLPNADGYEADYQNTDPYVFDDNFKYFLCKQYKAKNKALTKLSKLDRGALILFGSTINQNKEDAFFQLDTVFVVSEFIEYDTSDPNALSNLGIYKDSVFKMAFPKPTDFSLKLRLYKGANFQNTVEGMYSFSPAKIWDNQQSGFPRIPLRDMDYITNNLNSAPKTTEASLVEVKAFWNKIIEISRTNGCVEGVKFSYGRE